MLSAIAVMIMSGAWAQAGEVDASNPATLPALSPTLVAPSPPETVQADGSDYAFLEQQVFRGEAASAQSALETIVEQIEATSNRYDEDLLVPLTLLGDALMVQGESSAAIDQYDRARHIARVSFGLFDERQLPVVYREAAAFRKIGDLQAAGEREEYAYEVMQKAFAEYDPKLIPGLMRLGKFYLETYNYFAARSLFNRAMLVHAKNGTEYDLEAIPALQGIALSHKLERFPPFYMAPNDSSPLQGPVPQSSALEGQQIVFNNFPAGEKALQQIIEIRRRQEPQDYVATHTAMVELADWHLMFGRSNTANTLYTHVYEQMLASGEDPVTFFADPQLVYLPRPHNPRPPKGPTPPEPVPGLVKLQFNVSTSGRVRQLKTVESQPPKLMDFRVRRSMREAVYRPRLIEGVPVATDDHIYVHNFNYYPSVDPALTSAPEVQTVAENPEVEE